MLKLQGVELSKSYRGRKVVDDVELEIGQGEVVGLLGPNGAGKTTTFYILVGLARPDSGRVLLNGEEITDLPMYLARPQRDQLSSPGTLGLSPAYLRTKSSGGTGNTSTQSRATA